jgi:uncharacterized protein (TIGR02145 family)
MRFIIITFGISIYGCKNEEEPVVLTSPVSFISDADAESGGTITSEGSSAILNRGVCWSSSPNPTIADNKTSEGTGMGAFSSTITGLEKSDKYYIRAYATNEAGTAYGATVIYNDSGLPPSVESSTITSIDPAGATLECNLNANGVPTVVTLEYGTTTSYGWSLSYEQNPVDGTTPVVISIKLIGLNTFTVYHCRIKAVNSLGMSLGNDITFSTTLGDIDGNSYSTVQLGDQVWMQENLRTTKYCNGDLVETTSPGNMDISGESDPRYQWECSDGEFGRFYTYYAITDSRSVCPAGWHVPTDSDWTKLTDYLIRNGYAYNGIEDLVAKSMAAKYSFYPDPQPGNVGNDEQTNNSSGFSGLATGGRMSTGILEFVGYHAIWWSSTEETSSTAFFRCIGYTPGSVYRGIFSKSFGLPVRCLHN